MPPLITDIPDETFSQTGKENKPLILRQQMNKRSFISDDKKQGWTLLYDKYKTLFTKFAFKNFSVAHDTVEDIYQESFTVLYEKIRNGDFTASVSLQTYLFAIGKYKLLNYLRDNQRETTDLSEDILPPYSYDDETENWERKQEIVYQAVCRLQSPCNRILSLFYYDRKSMAEIARLFNYKNEQVAKNRKYLCISKLKESLIPQLKEENLI